MQIEPQDYLDLLEESEVPKLCFWDTEATGLKGDYNSVLCISVKPFGRKPISLQVVQPGNDQRVVREAKELLESFACWCTFYGSGYDLKLLNTRLTKWGSFPVEPRHHIDLFFKLKTHLLTARKSQAHLLRFFNCESQKMDMNPDFWNLVLEDPKKNMKTMVKRCESDAEGLEALYRKTRHLIRDIKRG